MDPGRTQLSFGPVWTRALEPQNDGLSPRRYPERGEDLVDVVLDRLLG